MKEGTKKTWKALCNKYVAALFVFAIIVCFVDENNLIVMGRLYRQVRSLHKEETTLYADYLTDSAQAASLRYDSRAIERYGRENYYMKRANEDIFIIKDAN
ncbi:MAG: hypothetical protein SPJ13_02295 [Bacteroidales bacterium]|nr:hypothetical protein [Bacteroidales bacterium]